MSWDRGESFRKVAEQLPDPPPSLKVARDQRMDEPRVRTSAERQVVRLLPASLVRVWIEGRADTRWSDVVLLCESSLGREQARLHRGLLSNGRWTGVFRYASTLCPKGTVFFRLWNRRTGRALVQHSLECRKGTETVTLRL